MCRTLATVSQASLFQSVSPEYFIESISVHCSTNVRVFPLSLVRVSATNGGSIVRRSRTNVNVTTSPVTAIFSFFLFFLFPLGGFQRNVSVTVESGGIEERSEEKEFLRARGLFGSVRFSFAIYR